MKNILFLFLPLVLAISLPSCGVSYLTLTLNEDKSPNVETIYNTDKKLLMSTQANSFVSFEPEKIIEGSKDIIILLGIQIKEAQSENILFDPEDIKVVFYKGDKEIPAKIWNPVIYESTKLIKQRRNETLMAILNTTAAVANAYNQSAAVSKGDYSKANYYSNQQDQLQKNMVQEGIDNNQRKENIHISKDEFIYQSVLSNLPPPFTYQINGKIMVTLVNDAPLDSKITAMEIKIPVGDDIHTYVFDIAKYKN